MAKTKALVISGPMDAKHIGGVNVMSGVQQSGIDSYFKNITLEPDETPSHTFTATGKTELPRRSETIASTIRRPSLSIKRSLSKLRRESISLNDKAELDNQKETSIRRTESTKSHGSLRMQSSISRLRQRVGLDRDTHTNTASSKPVGPELETVPGLVQKDTPPLRGRRSISRFTLRSTSTTPEPGATRTSRSMQRQDSFGQRQPSAIQRRPSPAESERSIIQRRPPPIERKLSPAHRSATKKIQPTRPKRVDSGTAIDLKGLPVDERPLGFQAILALQSFEDRMKHYARARHYWAHAEHGLAEWTQAAIVPRVVTTSG